MRKANLIINTKVIKFSLRLEELLLGTEGLDVHPTGARNGQIISHRSQRAICFSNIHLSLLFYPLGLFELLVL
jgi:hypothetical protein